MSGRRSPFSGLKTFRVAQEGELSTASRGRDLPPPVACPVWGPDRTARSCATWPRKSVVYPALRPRRKAPRGTRSSCGTLPMRYETNFMWYFSSPGPKVDTDGGRENGAPHTYTDPGVRTWVLLLRPKRTPLPERGRVGLHRRPPWVPTLSSSFLRGPRQRRSAWDDTWPRASGVRESHLVVPARVGSSVLPQELTKTTHTQHTYHINTNVSRTTHAYGYRLLLQCGTRVSHAVGPGTAVSTLSLRFRENPTGPPSTMARTKSEFGPWPEERTSYSRKDEPGAETTPPTTTRVDRHGTAWRIERGYAT